MQPIGQIYTHFYSFITSLTTINQYEKYKTHKTFSIFTHFTKKHTIFSGIDCLRCSILFVRRKTKVKWRDTIQIDYFLGRFKAFLLLFGLIFYPLTVWIQGFSTMFGKVWFSDVCYFSRNQKILLKEKFIREDLVLKLDLSSGSPSYMKA